jgi:hypothetical protein
MSLCLKLICATAYFIKIVAGPPLFSEVTINGVTAFDMSIKSTFPQLEIPKLKSFSKMEAPPHYSDITLDIFIRILWAGYGSGDRSPGLYDHQIIFLDFLWHYIKSAIYRYNEQMTNWYELRGWLTADFETITLEILKYIRADNIYHASKGTNLKILRLASTSVYFFKMYVG